MKKDLKTKLFRILSLFLVLALATLPVVAVFAAAGDTTRVSVTTAGAEGDAYSYSFSMSSDGLHVAFTSGATNLVGAGLDTNLVDDVFVRNISAVTTTRVSVDSLGVEGNAGSFNPSISSDGHYVAFESVATNLVAGDANAVSDIFVRDTVANVTTRVSVTTGGVEGNGYSINPAISSDGHYVAFESVATNLVAGDTNAMSDIFVRDTTLNVTTRVSVDSLGVQGDTDSFNPSISGNGLFVAFYSDATNLVAGDTNTAGDVFLRDIAGAATTRVSVDSSGAQVSSVSYVPSVSFDGRYVAFSSISANLVAGDTNNACDVFLRDTTLGVTARVSLNSNGVQGNACSQISSISADGRYVAFESDATNLAASDTNGQTDIFVRDIASNSTTRVSRNSGGSQANGSSAGGDYSIVPSISGDGRFTAFQSYATNMVNGDTNSALDVFVHEYGVDISSIAPNYGLISGGTTVVIAGTKFDGAAVTFGGLAAVCTVDSSTQITCVTPAHALGAVDVVVTVPTGSATVTNGFSYENPPVFSSIAANDGWTLESSEYSSQGNMMNNSDSVLRAGDNSENKQYRSLLYFDTAKLPNNATITRAELKIKKSNIVGNLLGLGYLTADMAKGFFGLSQLETTDFQAPGVPIENAGAFGVAADPSWYQLNLSSVNFKYVNLFGATQFRLRFKIEDNNNTTADYIAFYSGNAATAADRPQFIVWYTTP
jgi:Tol biopolymer transport system component